ncbi:hypothetical protein AXF42_Ash002837 [Apostasia shenzhenica]|uniref:Maternal effect embryo arrest 22 n=1 Tax=Apostasia shenzhenica TaxID=1088818 RepID=A0A2I0A7F0_9ASPA|nr:hypothetical protein AXF42_Ash002837 [Apostasia shenzhenica]
MAGDVQLGSPNPCCALWMKRSQKLEESRQALRQSVKILDGQVEKQSAEIDSLKKGVHDNREFLFVLLGRKHEDRVKIEKLRIQIEQGKDEMQKETNIKMQLEKKVQDMMAEISSFQKAMSTKSVDIDGIGVCTARNSGGEKEIKKLKDLLEKERRKIDAEMRKTEQEKKNAADALKFLKDEKKTAAEQKNLMEVGKKKVEDLRLCLERLKTEASEAREMLKLEKAKALQAKTQLEVEKKNSDRQKRHVDVESAKVKELKGIVEQEKKRNLEIENLANHLCQKLEEERLKREEMQKKIEDIRVTKESALSYSSSRERSGCELLEVAKYKLLKETLKLERKRRKHAERVAKLEKSEKKIVMQEIHLLKHSLTQILCRLNMLDGLISDNKGGIAGVPKIVNSSDWKGLNLSNFLQSKKGIYNSETGFESLESCPMDPLNYTGPAVECIGLPISRGCCNRANTGIISDFEPPVRGPIRNKSQTSAVRSSRIDFSDRNLMGSQGRDFIVEISPNKLAENAKLGLTVLKLPDEVVNNGMHNTCQDDLKSIDGLTCLVGADKAADMTVDPEVSHCSKKRKIQKGAESIAQSENNMFHSKIGDILSTLKDSRNSLDQLAPANCSMFSATFKNTGDGKIQDEGQSIMCRSSFDNKVNEVCTDYQIEKVKIKHHNAKASKKSGEKIRSTRCIPKAAPDSSGPVNDQAAISRSKVQANLASFKNMIKGGALKLLELDSDADEERYRKALEMPLSPNLPEIKTRSIQLDGKDDFHSFLEKDNSIPLCSFDVLDRDMISANPKTKICPERDQSINNIPSCDIVHDSIHRTFVANNGGPLAAECNDSRMLGSGVESMSVVVETALDQQGHPADLKLLKNSSLSGDTFDKAPAGIQTMDIDCIRNLKDAVVKNGPIFDQSLNLMHNPEAYRLTKNNSFLADEKAALCDVRKSLEPASVLYSSPPTNSLDDSEADSGISLWSIAAFSTTWNFESMSRILHAFNTLQNCLVSQIDFLFAKVLSTLLLEKGLQSEEKVAVLFSFLLGNISARISVHCKDAKGDDSFVHLQSLALDISIAVCDEKTKYALDQIFPPDALFSLMESFLIQREVLVIGNTKQHLSSSEDFLQNKFHLDVGSKCVTSNDVSINQFLAGCMILASVCVAAENIGYLLIVSFKLLRSGQEDISWILLALHVFAKICGNKFFNVDTDSFLLTTVISLVSHLERGIKSVSVPSKMVVVFSPCVQCPFATNALTMEELTGFLLDVLEDYSLCRTGCRSTGKLSISLKGTDLGNRSTSQDDHGVHCSASCVIFGFRKLDESQSDFSSHMALCHFTDVISLVELVGYYMSWEWICKEIMPRLLKILEACVSEDLSATLFVLAGELGRLGIISDGYEHYGITELKWNLTKLLEKLIPGKSYLPAQFAAIGALLHLLPVNFEDVISHSQDATSESAHIKHIKNWFSCLSVDQQSAAMSLYSTDDFAKKVNGKD